MMKPLHLYTTALLLCITGVTSAQVHRCVDNDGRVTFTDNLCPKSTAKGNVVKANQKYVGSEASTDTNWAAKNEAFNQRQASRDRNDMLETPAAAMNAR